MKNLLLIIIIWLLLYPTVGTGQSLIDCKNLLREAYKQMSAMGMDVPEGKTYYMDYTVETKLRRQPNQAGKEQIKTYLTSTRMMLTSNQMDIFADPEQTFKIIHSARRVYLTKTSKGLGASQRMNRTFALRDSLLEYIEVSVCDQEEDGAGRPVRKIVLTCSPRGLQLFNYRQVEFWLSEKDKTVARVSFQFGKTGDMESLDYAFKEINLEYLGDAMPPSFRNYLLRPNGSLKGKYEKYQLIDLRKKK